MRSRTLAPMILAMVLLGRVHPGAATEPSEPLRVFAAASLTEAFQDLAPILRESAPGVEVQFNFAASSALAAQIRDGAPADVIATADEPTMKIVGDAGLLAGAPVVFARNRLTIVVEAGNPKGVKTLADLARGDLVVVLAAPEVPVGRYARALLSRAGVEVTPKSLEANVKAVVTKVSLGEADAGIAYRTDALAAAGKVQGIDVPEAAADLATYPVAVVKASARPDAAKAFVDLLLSARGREVLRRRGFEAPAGEGKPAP
jgi:molybdate transport system substrate-binding protein